MDYQRIKARSDQPGPFSRKALIVDDDESQAMLSQILLERLGYEVTTCCSPADALRYFGNPEIIFNFVASDYTMFPMDGLELARKILELSPSTVVLLLTGYDHPALIREARSIGVREVSPKPTTAEEFAEVLFHAGL